MPTYLDAIKAALANKSGKGTNNNSANGTKLAYWKPTLGEHDVRFLPLKTQTGEPFLEVLYYEGLSERRTPAPYGFGLEDPIKEQFEKLRKTKEGWAVAKFLQPRKRFYGVVIVRGDENKGPQVWEFAQSVRDDIYKTLCHKDNVDEDMLSFDAGYDFTCSVTPTIDEKSGKVKMYKGNACKTIDLKARKKPSPLSKNKADADKWIAAIPNLAEMFKQQCKEPAELVDMLENFVERLASGGSTTDDSEAGTDHTASRSGPDTKTATEAGLNDAFAGLING